MKVHLISIGGAVMHNLALELRRLGHVVSGSDDEIFEPSRTRLSNAGLLPEKMGWDQNRITSDLDCVILGMHAKSDNPELIKAGELGIKIQSFPEFVAEHASKKQRVVIAGSHGKTTTTAMVMHILLAANREFDYLVGSKLDGFDLMVKLSDAPLIIIEGDEYLSSALDMNPKFLWYKPQISVITGIAWDHINVFPTYEMYVHQFERFLDSIPDGGVVYYYENDEDLSRICSNQQRINTCSYSTPKFELVDGHAQVVDGGRTYEMKVFGAHNFANMQAAVKVVGELGIDDGEAWTALSSFAGTARRLEPMKLDNIIAFKDFAHSPSKVRATVEAVKDMYPDKELVAVLELHTFSSLNKDFLPLYRDTMEKADVAIVHYNPHVLEMKSMPDLDQTYVQKNFGAVEVITDREELVGRVSEQSTNNNVYLFMSSGNWGGIDWGSVLPGISPN